MNRLILIGNGFDLAHGSKTGYDDFIKWYLTQALETASRNRTYEDGLLRSEEHTSELQSLMRISYAVFCLKKKKKKDMKAKRKRRHRRKHVYNPKPTTKKYNNKKHKEKYTHNQHKPSMTNK